MATQYADDRKLTIAEIATLAGVSKPTVSKVLNGRPDVADATRSRVERVIAEQGFVRNSAARALGAGRTGLIDLVVLELDSPYIVQIIQGVEETLERAGYSMVLTVTPAASANGCRGWSNTRPMERSWCCPMATRRI